MRRCGLCGKEIPGYSAHNIDKNGRPFHIDCSSVIRAILHRRDRRRKKKKVALGS